MPTTTRNSEAADRSQSQTSTSDWSARLRSRPTPSSDEETDTLTRRTTRSTLRRQQRPDRSEPPISNADALSSSESSSSSEDEEDDDLAHAALHQAQVAAEYAKHAAEDLYHEAQHVWAESFLYVRDKYRHALKLYQFEQIPSYLQDNEFIHSGYRVAYSAKEAWLSVVHVHNETGNIWTHLIALVFFLGLLVAYGYFLPDNADVWDYLVMAVFLVSAINCFLFSTLFHIHYCNSQEAFNTFGCFDYAGISLLIAGSTAVVTYYSFYCHDTLRRVWLGILAGISLIGLVGPMFKVWSTDRFRVARTSIYIGSGVVSAVPALQYIATHGLPDLPGMGLYGWIIMASCYILGAMIYAFKIPECFLPGKFDFLFHSHQFWHLAVLAGAYVHYRSCLDLVKWRLGDGQCDLTHPEMVGLKQVMI